MSDKENEKDQDQASPEPTPETPTPSYGRHEYNSNSSHTVEKVKSEGRKLQTIPGVKEAILVPDDYSIHDI